MVFRLFFMLAFLGITAAKADDSWVNVQKQLPNTIARIDDDIKAVQKHQELRCNNQGTPQLHDLCALAFELAILRLKTEQKELEVLLKEATLPVSQQNSMRDLVSIEDHNKRNRATMAMLTRVDELFPIPPGLIDHMRIKGEYVPPPLGAMR